MLELNKEIKKIISNFDPDYSKNQKKRVAICIKGAVSKFNSPSMEKNFIYDLKNGYINYRATYNCFKKHILEPNKNFKIDIFLHCWNEDLKKDLVELYQPVLSLFENNEMYADEISERSPDPWLFSTTSQALAIKRVIQLKEEYERRNSFEYDIVIIYRPDLILLKDLIIDHYDLNKIYCNNFSWPEESCGDLHFVMSNGNSRAFKGLYDSAFRGNIPKTHLWTKNYIINFMGKEISMDGIIQGRDQQIARPEKIQRECFGWFNIQPEVFYKYGFTPNDLGLN